MMKSFSLSPKFTSLFERCYLFFQTFAYTAAFVVVAWFLATCRNYNNEVYTMETDYLRWVTRVPAFSVCPAVDGRFVAQQLLKFSKHAEITPRNVSFFVNVLRPGKKFCLNCPVSWPKNLPTNISNMISILTPPCETQLSDCYWNGKPFACCQYFRPLLTKQGLCYSLNSEQTKGGSGDEPFDMVTSIHKPEANLEVAANTAFSLYISDRKSVIMKKPRFFVNLGKKGEVQYKFTETVALDSASELSASQRFCAIDGEINLPGFLTYSYTACKTRCIAQRQQQFCGCQHHLLTGTGVSCGLDGLECLDYYSKNLTKPKCSCKHECTGQDIEYVHFSLTSHNLTKAIAAVILTKSPTERTVYYAETTLIETIVGFACMTRLVTTATLHDSLRAFWAMFINYSRLFRYIKSWPRKK